MSDQSNSPPNSPPTRRRSSFAGQTFADIFGSSGRSRNNTVSDSTSSQSQGPIASAAVQANRRRLSLTTLGLSGSPNQSSPFGSFRGHRDSISSANSGSIDESAIEDEPSTGATPNQSAPNTPFARRMSFGARALRDVKTGGGGGGGDKSNGSSPSTAKKPAVGPDSGKKTRFEAPTKSRGSGFDWSDNFRSRAERSSISGGGMLGAHGPGGGHARAKSVATMEQPAVRDTPKPANVPDHFQERILKGDFYMD